MMKELLKDIYRTLNPYFFYIKKYPVQKNTILYEAFFGRSISCSPYAIFQKCLKSPECQGFEHYWVVDDKQDKAEIISSFASLEHVHFVQYKSKEYYKCLATAEYLVNNSTFPECFMKRDGQTYINTWHGIPLKHMGFDMVDGPIGSANTLRNFLQADYLLSPNEFHSRMYLDAYKMRGLLPGKIIETGQARCDAFFGTEKSQVIDLLKRQGVQVDDQKEIILYAPTWKGADFANPDMDLSEYQELKQKLLQQIDTSRYQVLIKPHQTVYNQLKKKNVDVSDLVPPTVDTNTLLSAVAILISDYSSIFFDFLVTGRPILFYIPDLDDYQNSRGMYFDISELPGPATNHLDELVDMIKNIEGTAKDWKEQYQKVRSWACPYEDGHVCERIIQYVFGGLKNQSGPCKVPVGRVYKEDSGKKKILFFLGALRSHGITSSMMGLLKNLDYRKYDVTLYIYRPSNEAELQRMQQIPEEVRTVVHTKSALGNPLETVQFAKQYTKKMVSTIGKREYARMFGMARFDYVIDFVGYSPLFSAVAAMAPSGVKSIWMHNDMQADKERKVNGKFVNKDRLEKVFQTYQYFDNLISCAKSVMEVNESNLSQYYHEAAYKYVRNSIDLERITDGLQAAEENMPEFTDLVTGKKVVIQTEAYQFVSMGRLSTEKNHMQLILAMKELLAKEKTDARLIILGDGPLREKLIAAIKENGLTGKVLLLGNVDNPFAVMKHCQCFVLPSLHEGQPMVVLEARTIGLKILLADFSTVKDVMQENGQLVVKNDVQAIAEGLHKAVAGKIPDYEFDGRKYNQVIMKEFERAIEKSTDGE